MSRLDSDEQSAEQRARADWEQRIYRRLTDVANVPAELSLPAPENPSASSGVGHVRLEWDRVDGAAGYLIERRGPDGEQRLLQHGGSDVPAVVAPPFADTGITDGVEYRYRFAAVAGADIPAARWSGAVRASSVDAVPDPVAVTVDAARVVGRLDRVWRMVGSERLTQLRFGDDANGNPIGIEFADALRRAHDDLGVSQVRAHAILHDDNRVVARAADGSLSFDFTLVDAIYDQVLDLGLRPVVELSFMPAAIARDPDETVFAYRGIISPPESWSDWYEVVRALAAHLVDRYGVDEVAGWGFEVWNEPNLVVFWSGTQQEYLRLYEETARAVKDVDERLRVGGPSTAAGEWIEALAGHAADNGLPLDFVTSHTYGNVPLDAGASLHRHGFEDVPVWWTEWGVGSTHYGPIHDGVSGAPFVLSGFAAVQGRMEALAYWVVSDHFEELGRPPALFHNGFGLLTVGNLRKPRYWAVHLAAHLGDHVLASDVTGDGAGVLVQAWATRHDDGTIDVLVWNGTVNAELMHGDQRLDRRVTVSVDGLGPHGYRATLARVDAGHSNIVAAAPAGTTWPDPPLWDRLRAADRLHEVPLDDIAPAAGRAEFELVIPMPGVARIRLSAGDGAGHPDEES
jgi:xylan 1,4-beta-xylosidase